MEIKGRSAIVTGSSSVIGIGAETARAIAAKGCNVVINYVNNEKGAEETVAACRSHGVKSFAIKGDVSKDQDCKNIVQETIKEWGRIDVLVNNAATTKPVPQSDLDALTAEEFLRIYSVNVVGTFQMTRASAPFLRLSGDAAVVNISSIVAIRYIGVPYVSYGVTKAGILQLTQSIALEYAEKNIRANSILPGLMNTPMIIEPLKYAYANGDVDKMLEIRHNQVPMKKMGDAWDVAYAALFLASDEANTSPVPSSWWMAD